MRRIYRELDFLKLKKIKTIQIMMIIFILFSSIRLNYSILESNEEPLEKESSTEYNATENILFSPSAALNTADIRTLRELADENDLMLGASVSQWETYDPLFTKTLFSEFNTMTSGYESCWPTIHPSNDTYNFREMDDWVNMGKENNMTMFFRGESVWFLGYPDWIAHNNPNGSINQITDFNREELLNILHDYIENVVGRYKEDIEYWYMANEVIDSPYYFTAPYVNTTIMRHNFWYDTIGPDYLEYVYNWTAEVAPDAKLFLNEGTWWGNCQELGIVRDEFFYNLVVDLLAKNVPIHGVGLQFYPPAENLGDEFYNFTLFSEQIERYIELGLEVHISETGPTMLEPITEADLQNQATLYENLTNIALAYENLTALVIWGLNDNVLWLEEALQTDPHLFTRDNYQKPGYYAIKHLLQGNTTPYIHDFNDPLVNPPDVIIPDVSWLDPPHRTVYRVINADYQNSGNWLVTNNYDIAITLNTGDLFGVEVLGYPENTILQFDSTDYYQIDIAIDGTRYDADYTIYDSQFIRDTDSLKAPEWSSKVFSENPRYNYTDWAENMQLHANYLFDVPEFEITINESVYGYRAENANLTFEVRWSVETGLIDYYLYNGTGNEDTLPLQFEFIMDVDNNKPEWTNLNLDINITQGETYIGKITAMDNVGIGYYWLNDSLYFDIDQNGLILCSSFIPVGDYSIEMRAYDFSGNYCSQIWKIEVQTPINSNTSSTNESKSSIPWYGLYKSVTFGILVLLITRTKRKAKEGNIFK